MKLYEYEGKELFRRVGIPVPQGKVASSPEEAYLVASEIGKEVVIKSQILQGGRGKAGGIKFATSPEEAKAWASELLGQKLKTEEIKKVLIEEKLDIAEEWYLSFTVDPAAGAPLLMISRSGGVDIEEIALQTPEKIITERINIFHGLMPFQARRAAFALGLEGNKVNELASLMLKLYRLFRQYDAELVEINPLVVTSQGEFIAADAKVIIYDNALYRQKEFVKGPERFEDEREYRASQYGLSYVKLDGNIGVLCTGAGLTMTTLDLITYYGGRPANFLEFGGATYRNSYYALEIVLSDPDVKVVLINTFGLVARADVISEGLAQAIEELKPQVPIVASIRGTGEEEARKILESRVGLKLFPNVEAAVQEAVRLAGSS